jgi:hypothetical protein
MANWELNGKAGGGDGENQMEIRDMKNVTDIKTV